MNRRILTTAAAVGATLALGVPTALGSGEPIRDHGDASQAKLAVQPSSIGIVRDYGDASQAKLMTQSSPALEIARDHGDATRANLQLQSPPMEVIRDHGDATQVKLTRLSSAAVARENAQRIEARSNPVIVRDHGDAALAAQSPGIPSVGEVESTSGWELDWSQLAIGFGVGMVLLLGLVLGVQLARNERLAH